MALVDDEAYYQGPDYAEGKLYDKTWGQWIWALSCLCISVFLVFVVGNIFIKAISLVIFLLVGALGWWTYNDGPGYLLLFDSFANRRTRKNDGYIEAATVSKTTGAKKRPSCPIDDHIVAIELGCDTGHTVKDGSDLDVVLPTGFISSGDNSRMTFIVAYGGSKRPSMDWESRLAAEQRVVNILNEGAALVGFETVGLRIAPIVGRRPFNPHSLLKSLALYDLHPDFISPPEGSIEEGFASALDERLITVTTHGSESVTAYAFTLNTPPEWLKAIRKNQEIASEEVVSKSPIALLVDHVIKGLQACDVQDPRCLNVLEMDEFIRTQANVAKIADLHMFLHQRRERFVHKKLSVDEVVEELIATPPWPSNLIRLGRDYIYWDGTYARVYRTTSFGRSQKFRPGELLHLQLVSGVNTTSTMSALVRSAVDEEARLTRSIVWSKALAKDGNRYYSQREKDDQGRTQNQQTRLYEQNAPVGKVGRYVVVLSPTKAGLASASLRVTAKHILRGITLRPIKGESRQIRAFLMAILGVDP